ncbi:HAD family phosphatase [Yoonia sp. BS5-3]|uniref:HAD family hydrolase n=1 Tax=Yoonia phaeophyticola TaxID=3137369 RepID=A0ABZ2V2K6_9RHOB
MTTPIKAVIFDMDGLLLDTEQVYLQGYRNARTAMDLSPYDAGFLELIGLPNHAGRPFLEAHLGPATDAFEAQWDQEIRKLMQAQIPAKPRVRDVIEALQDRQIPYAIATSTYTQKAHNHLARAGLDDLFPLIIGGDQVVNGKPAPDIYLKAAATLCIAPGNCAAFEDSENGVRAAVAAGMQTVQVPDIKPPSEALLSLGHHVAETLVAGAQMLNLMES